MRDVLPAISAWQAEGKRVALATVVKVWGSAPRPLGAKMAISDAGDMVGSVSGGCVEGAVFTAAQEVIDNGVPQRVHFGVADETAWSVGLSCGGEIEVWIEPFDRSTPSADVHRELIRCLTEEALVALATIVDGPGVGQKLLVQPGGITAGQLPTPALTDAVVAWASDAFSSFASGRHRTASEPACDVFLEVLPPRPQLVVVGAVHVAIPLIAFANTLGFRTIVVDPRTAFLTPERFAHADLVSTQWPDQALAEIGLTANTYVALLSHDLKLDVPALSAVLAHQPRVRYIGALGSQKTHAKRVAALGAAGFSPAQLALIHNPIGLPLGGRRAEEVAVAIIAEIVAVSHGIAAKSLLP